MAKTTIAMDESMKEKSPNPEKPGLLDRIDVWCGQFSDGVDTVGKRRRSFGATVFFWMSLPGIFLVTMTAMGQLLIAWNTGNHIPLSVVSAYKTCVNKAKTVQAAQVCKIPEAKPSKALVKGILDLGWPPWCFVGLLVLIGFASWLLRDQLHLKAFVESAQALSVYVTAGKTPPDAIVGAVSMATARLGGALSTPAPGTPEAISAAKTAPPEDPGMPPPEKSSM